MPATIDATQTVLDETVTYPPVLDILLDAAAMWQYAYHELNMSDPRYRAANHALDAAVGAYGNAPYRRPAAIDRGMLRGALESFAQSLLELDRQRRCGLIANPDDYGPMRDALTTEAVSNVLHRVALCGVWTINGAPQTHAEPPLV